MRPPRGVCLQCGLPGIDGLCGSCDTLRDLEGAAQIATCLSLARSRLEYIRLEIEKAIDAARGRTVTLDLCLAARLSKLLADAELEADARSEADAFAWETQA
jgi:hypothetical protein